AVAKKASTTANSSIVEEQLKLVGGVISRERLAEAQNLSFIGDVGDVAGNANIPGQPWLGAEIACLGHTRRGKIAHCHVAARGDEPAHQLASHTAAATRNDRKLAGEIEHPMPPSPRSRRSACAGAPSGPATTYNRPPRADKRPVCLSRMPMLATAGNHAKVRRGGPAHPPCAPLPPPPPLLVGMAPAPRRCPPAAP